MMQPQLYQFEMQCEHEERSDAHSFMWLLYCFKVFVLNQLSQQIVLA